MRVEGKLGVPSNFSIGGFFVLHPNDLEEGESAVRMRDWIM
jgi:hypothetical protein